MAIFMVITMQSSDPTLVKLAVNPSPLTYSPEQTVAISDPSLVAFLISFFIFLKRRAC
jgi:hypothetical protein